MDEGIVLLLLSSAIGVAVMLGGAVSRMLTKRLDHIEERVDKVDDKIDQLLLR